MMTATECPSADQLRELTLGRLPEEASDELLSHLRDCATCQSELETIGDAEDSLIDAIRKPDHLAGLTDEPDCRVAVLAALGAIAGASRETSEGRQPMHVVTDIPPFPVSIGEYEIVRPLGRGGMGNVYLARHTKLGRQVALKVLAAHRLADTKMKERFEAEMRAVGRLSHPGIVTAHDAREVDGTAVLVTEFIDGLDLSQLVSHTGPIDVANACEIVRQVAVALQFTSDQGFVHRDVKPSNIMLGASGEVKLLDLGLARLQDSSELTTTGQAMGTADYIAPEQVDDSRGVDVRADIYSLGCTLFKLLTGVAPFADPEHATAFAKMTAHVEADPPKLGDFIPDAPSGLVKLVAKMLSKDPGSRPQTPLQIAETLTPLAKGADLSALIDHARTLEPKQGQASRFAATHSAKIKPWRRRTVPITAAIAAGFMGLMIGLMGGFLIRIKAPDGTEMMMKVPEGSEISITPDDGNEAVQAVAQTPSVLNPAEPSKAKQDTQEPFLKFAILETDQQSIELAFAEPVDKMWRWYPVAADFHLPTAVERWGQKFHLVRESDALPLRNGELRDQIESLQSTGSDLIELRLSEAAGQQIRELTRNNLQRKLAIIVNGRIRMAPTIRSEIGRQIAITGKFTKEEIKFLMDSLGSGLVEPLKTPPNAINTKTDLERLQGVWQVTNGPAQTSQNALWFFDGSDVYIGAGSMFRSAGMVTLEDGNPKRIAIKVQANTDEQSLSAIYRFLPNNRIELRADFDPTSKEPQRFDDDATSPTVASLFFQRLGDVPTDPMQAQKLLITDSLLGLDSEQRNMIAQALMTYPLVKQMGFEAYAAAQGGAEKAAQSRGSNLNLKKIGIAFHNFLTVYRKFPASASVEQAGAHGIANESELQPFSWRVAILPFIEQEDLMALYRFDEPWDSESNLKLLPLMPSVYRSPAALDDQPTGHANYQGIVDGTGAIGKDQGVRIRDIRDGTSNTLLFLETQSSVPWTKPQDLNELPDFDDDAELHYGMADGSVRTMKPIDREKLNAMITIDGGETIEP